MSFSDRQLCLFMTVVCVFTDRFHVQTALLIVNSQNLDKANFSDVIQSSLRRFFRIIRWRLFSIIILSWSHYLD